MKYLLVLCICSLTLSRRCQWKDPKTTKVFNLDPLVSKKAPHKLEVNVLGEIIKAEYLFNFCDGPKPSCHGQHMHVAEIIEYLGKENQNTCTELGSLEQPVFKALDQDTEGAGFSMTYSNDKSCLEFNSKTHHLQVQKTSTQFNIYCHSGPLIVEKQNMSARRCTQVFYIYSQAGCPEGYSKSNAQNFRDVTKIFAIWLGVVCALLLGFALWVDQDKRLYKKLNSITALIMSGLQQARMKIGRCLRCKKSKEINDLDEYSYTSIGKQLQEI